MSRAPRDASRDGPKSGGSAESSAGYEETQALPEGTPASADSRLQEGEDVAGRYRVVRFIAQGGMGEVYEVEDRELHERIAMKTVRANLAGASAEAQFVREIQMSRSVTHPSVCRIFDVGHHVRASGARIVFLTMELLPGETLRERIRRDGALDLPTALRIVRQIASALTAAHEAGIVHRDLKSANVMLPPGEGSVRAVVTDFGLAHRVATGDDTITASAGIAGTPAYMAPEQVEGTEVTPQTDLYSLGVVMFEMVTGVLPFTGGNALSVAAKRLTTAPPSPRLRRPELPARWERAILACLERDATKRPRTPRAVVQLLDDETEAPAFESLHRARPWVRPATAALVIVVAALVGLSTLHARHDSLAFLVKERGVQLDALTLEGEPSGFDQTVRNALRLRLLGRVPMIDSPIVLGLPPHVMQLGVSEPPRALSPLHLDGSVRVAEPGTGRGIEVRLRILDPVTHRERWSTVQRGTVDEIAMLVVRAAGALEAEVGVPPRGDVTALEGEVAKKVDALMRRNEHTAAMEELERGLLVRPFDSGLLIRLADVWQKLTSDVYADVLTDRIKALGPLPDPAWQARATALAVSHDPGAVARALHAAYALRPHDLVLALDLVMALQMGEHTDDAAALLERLARESLDEESRMAVESVRIVADVFTERAPNTLEHFEAVAAQAHEARLSSIELEVLEAECEDLTNRSPLKTQVVCDRLFALGLELRRPDAIVVHSDGDAYRYQTMKDPRWGPAAVATQELAQQMGDLRSALLEQAMVARAVRANGDVARSDALYRDELAGGRAVGANPVVMQALKELSQSALEHGAYEKARKYDAQLVETSHDVESQNWVNFAVGDIARIELEEGHGDTALRKLRDVDLDAGHDALTQYHYCSEAVIVDAELGRDDDLEAQLAKLSATRRPDEVGNGEEGVAFWRSVAAYLRGRPAEMERAAQDGLLHAPHAVIVPGLRRMSLVARSLAHGVPLSEEELKSVDGFGSWLVADLVPLMRFSLRRVRGEPPATLLTELDAYIAALPVDAVRGRLRARLERLALLRLVHDPAALTEARAVHDEAHRAGLEAIARLAASLE